MANGKKFARAAPKPMRKKASERKPKPGKRSVPAKGRGRGSAVDWYNPRVPMPMSQPDSATCFDAVCSFQISTSIDGPVLHTISLMNNIPAYYHIQNEIAGTLLAGIPSGASFPQFGVSPQSIRFAKATVEIMTTSPALYTEGAVFLLRDSIWPIANFPAIPSDVTAAGTAIKANKKTCIMSATSLLRPHRVALLPSSAEHSGFYNYPGPGDYWSNMWGEIGPSAVGPTTTPSQLTNVMPWTNLYIYTEKASPFAAAAQKFQVTIRVCVQAKFAPGTIMSASESVQPTAPDSSWSASAAALKAFTVVQDVGKAAQTVVGTLQALNRLGQELR